MNLPNYQKELDGLLARLKRERAAGAPLPSLLLHSCCAPCSSYCMQYLRQFFQLTVFYYNPNISEREEYEKRAAEQKRLIAAYNEEDPGHPIRVQDGDYEPDCFFQLVKGYENCPEGGERCFLCYRQRLEKTAKEASAGGYDYFCTTLSISPLKNAAKINEIGSELAEQYGVAWLPSDFKKKDGYKQSVALSGEYGLYRQDYCGCVYSREARNACAKQEKPL